MDLIAMHSTVMSGAVLITAMIAVCAYAVDDVREIHNPLGFATLMTNANNGDLLMMKSSKRIRISDGGRKVDELPKMPFGFYGVTRLDDRHLIGRREYEFHVSADDGATWELRGRIDEKKVSGGEGLPPHWSGLGVPNYDVLIRARDGGAVRPTGSRYAMSCWDCV